MGGVSMLLRRAVADRGLLTLLVVIVAVTAGLAGAVPRLLTSLQRASLEQVVAEARPDQLGLSATTILPVSARDPDAAWERFRSVGDSAESELNPVLSDVIGTSAMVIDSIRYDLEPMADDPPDPLTRKLTVRLQEGIEPHLQVVEGVLPDGLVHDEEIFVPFAGPDAHGLEVRHRIHQFAATRDTADALRMEVGDRRFGLADASGPILARVIIPPEGSVVFELSAIVELSPVDDPVWFADPRLHRASQFDRDNSTTVFAFGLVTQPAIAELPGAPDGDPATVGWRWPLDEASLLDADVTAVGAAALALRTSAPIDVAQPRWSTGLDRVLAAEAARRIAAVEVLGIGAVSIVGVAAALLAAVSALLALRRRDTLALTRGRGASRGQLAATATIEAGVGILAAIALASAVLVWALPEGEGLGAVVAVGLLAGLVLVGGASYDMAAPLGRLLEERRRTERPPRSRHVLEGLLVVVAVVAVLSLRRRGVDVDGDADVLVIAAPVLVAAAAAVLTARIMVLPLKALDAAGRRGRGLAGPLGIARAARAPGGSAVVVLLVLGLGVAGLAASIHRTMLTGHAIAAQERVGADVRIDAAPLSTLGDAWTAPSTADMVVDMTSIGGSLVTDEGAQRVDVLLVDAAGIAALGADDGTLPPLAWDGTGAAPVVVSSVLQSAGSPDVDDVVTIVIGTDRVAGRITLVDPRVLGQDSDRDGAFVVLDADAVRAATGTDLGATSRLVRTGDPRAVAASALADDATADVLVREDVEAALLAAPLARGVRLGFLVAAVAAAVATALAIALTASAAAPARRRRAAVLSALGAPSAMVRTTLLVEVVPVVVVAATTGVLLAAVTSSLLGEHLDLSPFTGTAAASSIGLPPPIAAIGLVVGAAVLSSVATLAALGRVDPGTLLREGDA